MINVNLNGMFGKIAPGMCRLSMTGGIAVKTNEVRPEKVPFLGYRLYLSDSPTRETILLTGE